MALVESPKHIWYSEFGSRDAIKSELIGNVNSFLGVSGSLEEYHAFQTVDLSADKVEEQFEDSPVQLPSIFQNTDIHLTLEAIGGLSALTRFGRAFERFFFGNVRLNLRIALPSVQYDLALDKQMTRLNASVDIVDFQDPFLEGYLNRLRGRITSANSKHLIIFNELVTLANSSKV